VGEKEKKTEEEEKSQKKKKMNSGQVADIHSNYYMPFTCAKSRRNRKNNFTIWIYFSFTEREREKLLLLSFRKKITLGVGKLIAYYVHMAWLSLVRVRSLLLDLTTFTSCSWDSFFSLLVRPWTVKHKLGKWQPNGGRVLNPSSEPGRKIESKLFGLPHTLARMNQSHVALDEKITKPKWDKRHFFF
jgi:hypothetical protein